MDISKGIVAKFPSLKKYKPGVEFLFRLFFLIILGLVLKKLYWLISDTGGTLTIPLLAGFNLLESIRTVLIAGTVWGLELMGYPTFVAGWIVGIPHTAAVNIQTPCLGINVCLVFIALLVAYPSEYTWWQKALYIAAGVAIIQAVNVARMIAMVFVVKNRYILPIEHHDLFNMVIYAIIFGLFYLFISKK